MVWHPIILIVIHMFMVGLSHSNNFSISLSYGETPAQWAVKWNGIGESNDLTQRAQKSWRGIEITQSEQKQLVSQIKIQAANQIYADLLARPHPTISYYGTCAVGIVRGMPTFWVSGMYGSVGHSGYPKNPESGDGTGHLKGCYNEHLITGLCSFSDVAERTKQTLLYAVQNNVCTDYYDIKRMLGVVAIKSVATTTDVQTRATQYLKQVGLTIPPSGKGDKWITLCQVKARVRHSGWSRRYDVQSCEKTARGEIKEIRVKVNEEWSCSYRTQSFASGTKLDYQSNIRHLYDEAMTLAKEKGDKLGVKFIEIMKNEHMENIRVSTNMDTARLIATAQSAPFWGGGGNCDLVLEGRVNELY